MSFFSSRCSLTYQWRITELINKRALDYIHMANMEKLDLCLAALLHTLSLHPKYCLLYVDSESIVSREEPTGQMRLHFRIFELMSHMGKIASTAI